MHEIHVELKPVYLLFHGYKAFNALFTSSLFLLFKYIHSGKVDSIGSRKVKRNRLTNSKHFKKFCDSAFTQVRSKIPRVTFRRTLITRVRSISTIQIHLIKPKFMYETESLSVQNFTGFIVRGIARIHKVDRLFCLFRTTSSVGYNIVLAR